MNNLGAELRGILNTKKPQITQINADLSICEISVICGKKIKRKKPKQSFGELTPRD